MSAESDWVERARAAADGRRIIGVMGGGSAADEDLEAAETFGKLCAEAGHAVLTGGGGGIMEAASRGAALAGGVAIGVLPVKAPLGGYPNRHVSVALFTGLGTYDAATGDPGRNLVNILASDAIAAFPGAAGTNSEIRLAAAAGRPTVLVGWTKVDLEATTRESVERHGLHLGSAPTPEAAHEWLSQHGSI